MPEEKQKEVRPIEQYGYRSEMGRSSFFVDCPFCGEKGILVYAWSFAGSGKRCPKCRAMMTPYGAVRK